LAGPLPENIDALKPQVDALVKPLIQGGWCPGMAVGIFYKGRVAVWGYGSTALKNGKTPDGDTEFEIGSITKLFTKLLVSDMVHKGEMGLDDKAQSYMPPDVKLPSKDGREITLQMLSAHTSGLPRDPDDMENSDKDPQGHYTEEKLHRYLSRCRLDFVPGTRFQYSNTGVALLGYLISLKSGLAYEEYLRKLVFDPLGMADTGITWTDAQNSRASEGHNGDGEIMPLWKWKDPILAGCGAIHSTINDLIKMGKQVLDKESSPLSGIAFGETAQKLDWGPQVAHGGGTYGFSSLFYLDRDNKTILVVWGNTSNQCPLNTGMEIQKMLKGEDFHPVKLPVLTEVPKSQLKKYEGDYRVQEVPENITVKIGQIIHFKLAGDRLMTINDDKDATPTSLYPMTEGGFYVKNGGYQLAFNVDSRGRVKGVSAVTLINFKAVKVGYEGPADDPSGEIPPPP